MSKKIGIDIRCLMGSNYSGVAWYAFNLLDNLFKIDRENEYFLFYNSSKPVKLPEWKYDNVKFVSRNYPNKLFNLSLNFFSRPYLDQLVGGVDVWFSPNLHFSSVSANCRSVIAVHDLSFLLYPAWFTFKQRLWHQLILKKKILERADLIITDSRSTARDLLDQLQMPAAKIKVVYLGIDLDKFYQTNVILNEAKRNEGSQVLPRDPSQAQDDNIRSEELTRVKQKYDLPEKFFLFLSTIEPRKNLQGVIEAFKGVAGDSSLVVAGSWGWKSAAVKSLVQSVQRVKFLDYVEENDKPALYQLAQGLVYPSYYEGFGLPILEAMAAGCPVIAGNNSSQGEVLGDCGLLVDAFNVTEIRQAMELLMNDHELRNNLIARGRVRARTFSWNNTATEMLEIFRQI